MLYKAHAKAGMAPGTLQAPRGASPPSISVFAYDAAHMEELKIRTAEEIIPLSKKWPMVWVNVDGLADTNLIGRLGEMFGLHPLSLEDVLHIPQRPKMEEHDGYIFAVMRMAREEQGQIALEQLSLFWGKGFVLTFQESAGDGFDGVRERLRKGGKRIRMAHADYMAYALIDSVIDGYFPILEHYGDRLDALEEEILDKPSQEAMSAVHRVKRDLHSLRLYTWPLREALGKINADTKLVRKETLLFLRDCHDHVIQILDIVENYRERVSSLSDIYLSSISNRMNEVMKVLTIISTIFMPLTFIVGIYGMNFNTDYPGNMPELNQPYGYVVTLAVMVVIAVVMLAYFVRLGWIGFGRGREK